MNGFIKIVVAMPYSEVSNPMAQQLLSMVLLTVGSIMVSFVGTSKVVEYSLAPLNRLTDTATYVSTLPLASGAGEVGIRFADPSVAAASEVGRVGSAFNHMLDNVEGALAARHASETKVRRFVADASHELRNPLAAIRGYSELAGRDDEELPEDTAHAIKRISSESERMSALVDDLLLLARLDSEPDVQIVPTDITEIVLNAVSDAQVSGTDHNWVLQIPEAELVVPGNAAQLHQVVVNLLANARTHTPPGTTVTTSLQTVSGAVLLTVADDGPGVPEELRATAFERFSRADASRSRLTGAQSTGLGLAIVSAVIAAHHGQVTLESQPGRTVFSVWLPAAPPSPATNGGQG
jgi:two-component system OmpR family sensor kinase